MVSDMNLDKVPELVVSCSESYGYQGWCAIYSYVGGRVKEVYHFGNSMGLEEYYPSKGIFVNYGGRMGYRATYYEKLNSDGTTSALLSQLDSDTQPPRTTYYKVASYDTSGKAISKSTFTSLKKKLLGSASKKSPKLCKNTASNRNRYLVQSLKLNRSTAALSLKGTKAVQLKATVTGVSHAVKWSSSNKKIATVSSTGKVTGKCTIYAKANGKTVKCTITVK